MSDTTKMIIEKWIESTSFMSNPNQMVKHPLFISIKEREDIVPSLIEVLRERLNNQCMMGLGHILKETPVKPENRGYVSKMRQDWLEWFDKKELDKENEKE